MTAAFRDRVPRAARWPLGIAAVVGGVWLLLNTAVYRAFEGWLLVHAVTGPIAGHTYRAAGSSIVFIGLGGPHAIGLRIDQFCSSGGIAGLVCVITGLLIALAGVRIGRAFAAFAAMMAVVVAVNGVRMALLAWSATRWGVSGWFEWIHVYGGAAAMVVAIAIGCVLYVRLLRRSPVAHAG